MKLLKPPRNGLVNSCPRSHRVLALCGDTQMGLWMVRSLGRAGLKVFTVCRSMGLLAVHSRYSAGAWALNINPREPRFVDEIEKLARELDVGSIMTVAEEYHLVLIRSRDRFEPDIHIFSPSSESFAKATDKNYVHSLCRRLGIPVASGTILDRFMNDRDGFGMKFPMVLRTRKKLVAGGATTAPWKAAYAGNEQELSRLYSEVRGMADNVLVQECHPGVDDSVQVLMHDGEAFMAGEYVGEHHMPLAGGATVQRVTCRNEGLIDDAVRLLKAIGWEGIAGVQFHYDPMTGKYIFLEINPRFIGGLPTVIKAGFDAPLLLWQSRFEPHRMRRSAYQVGVRTRLLGGDANWVLGMIGGDRLPPGQKRLGKLSAAARFLWNFGPWTKDDVFAVEDIKPYMVDMAHMIKRLGLGLYAAVGNHKNGSKRRKSTRRITRRTGITNANDTNTTSEIRR